VFDRMMTFVVGESPDARIVQVRRGLLRHRSGLFRTLLQVPFKDNDSHALQNENAEMFQLFHN
jgi:hypothetical protein